MAEKRTWNDNVGQIFLTSGAECFWMFPTDFFLNRSLCFTSPWFTYEDDTWRLVKVPSNWNVTIYVWRKGRRDSVIYYNYKFKLSFKTHDSSGTEIYSGDLRISSEFGCTFSNICNLSDIRSYIFSQCGLTKLVFEIQKEEPVLDPAPNITPVSEEDGDSMSELEEVKTDEPERKGIERLTENLKQLLLNEENSDVVLKAEQREFRVHKAILGARSPVFASMFQHDMSEKESGVVDIPDCAAESFEVFLLYLYTGSADTMSEKNVFNLYYAADKYRVDDLKEECAIYMKDTLSVETICDVTALSLKHGETKLLRDATRFFRDNIKEIIKTVQWQKYLMESPIHSNELLIKALNP